MSESRDMHVFYTAIKSKSPILKCLSDKRAFEPIICVVGLVILFWFSFYSDFNRINESLGIIFFLMLGYFLYWLTFRYLNRIVSIYCNDNTVFVECPFDTDEIPISSIIAAYCTNKKLLEFRLTIYTESKIYSYFAALLFGEELIDGLNEFCEHMEQISEGRISIRSSLPE